MRESCVIGNLHMVVRQREGDPDLRKDGNLTNSGCRLNSDLGYIKFKDLLLSIIFPPFADLLSPRLSVVTFSCKFGIIQFS